MSSHPLPRSASALFSHVMADNAPLYRAILDVFAASKRQFRLHLRPDDVLIEATWPSGPPTLEAVQQALGAAGGLGQFAIAAGHLARRDHRGFFTASGCCTG